MKNCYIVIVGLLFSLSSVVIAQELPRCSERPLIAELPRVEPRLWCLERAIFGHEAGELAFTAIEFAPDGALYATRPLTGELYVMRDTDEDSLPDSPTVVATGMRFPNGLIYAENALYIIGDGHIYRFADDILETIVDDLPGGRGFMASGITYHDGWLYIGVPMPCDFCAPEDELHGTVVRLALNGSQREVMARGLRYPAGLTVWDGTLWVTDTGRDNARDILGADELNRIELNSDTIPHFGFPYCEGMANVSNLPGDFDCASVSMPTISLYTHSTPLALQPYFGDAFRFLRGDLLLVLGGSVNNADIRGYQVAYLEIEQDHFVIETVLPHDTSIAGGDRVSISSESIYRPISASYLNVKGAGVWPHRIFDVAVSPEGWIYISVGGGQIFVLRESDRDACEYRNCE
jgi:glucose/arabinose dehydrogenase